MRRQQVHEHEHEQTRVLNELCAMIMYIFRTTLTPLPVSFPRFSFLPYSSPPSLHSTSTSSRPLQISPAAFGALFIGISITLMLLGSVIFVIGLILMPLVITLVLLFCFAGMVSNLSEISCAILWPAYDSNYRISQARNY